jgi:antitoxin (DNA-binding transcriptional repressor) of toxin-antitoxin stability system
VPQVSIRALQEDATAVVARASAGETVTITDGEHPVAQLTAIPASRLEQLVTSGKARPPRSDVTGLPDPEPGPSVNATLAATRDAERY